MPGCVACRRELMEGEYAWRDSAWVIEPGGTRYEVRYTCDDCEGKR